MTPLVLFQYLPVLLNRLFALLPESPVAQEDLVSTNVVRFLIHAVAVCHAEVCLGLDWVGLGWVGFFSCCCLFV